MSYKNFLDFTRSRVDPVVSLLSCFLVALPVIGLVLSAASWLRFGVDMPFMDDWRQYHNGTMGRIDFPYLLASANDTLYSVGLFLDSLAVRYLDGNTVAYQFLSLVAVLGSLLFLQWRLLSRCVDNRLIAVSAFALTVLMLQPDTYWGWQNMAFHQAIPLVCVLMSISIMLSERWKASLAIPLLIAIGLISGFSYISGAFAILGLSFSILFLQKFMVGDLGKKMQVTGLALLGPAIVSAAAQFWVIIGVQRGTHRSDAPMAFPWEGDFWFFLLGKVARALMLPINHPALSLSITLIVVGLIFGALVVLANKFFRRELSERHASLFVVFFSLVVVVVMYLFLVSAGRTNLRPENVQSPLDIFTFGFHRFHFFWVTLLWPWLAAILMVVIFRGEGHKTPSNLMVILASAAILFLVGSTNLFGYNDFYSSTMRVRLDGLSCINAKIQKSEAVRCPQLEPNVDLSRALANGAGIDASFLRGVFYVPLPLGVNYPAPLYRMSDDFSDVRLFNAVHEAGAANSLKISAAIDPMLQISTGKVEQMRNCRMLEVNVEMAVGGEDIAQLFFVPVGKAGFSESDSKSLSVVGGTQIMSFSIASVSGFVDELRFDPVTLPRSLAINDLEVRCRALVIP